MIREKEGGRGWEGETERKKGCKGKRGRTKVKWNRGGLREEGGEGYKTRDSSQLRTRKINSAAS